MSAKRVSFAPQHERITLYDDGSCETEKEDLKISNIGKKALSKEDKKAILEEIESFEERQIQLVDSIGGIKDEAQRETHFIEIHKLKIAIDALKMKL
ncbi:MAG: hypothetical protein KR126chlam5_00030 [Candidatus Anoxychlamydiales bacterium]|nr:hypothetical protein [Candidatus Anoxychlamydiales bacterium]